MYYTNKNSSYWLRDLGVLLVDYYLAQGIRAEEPKLTRCVVVSLYIWYLYICVSAIAILLYITQIMGLLARLLSPFAFNTRVIDDVRSNPLVSVSNCCNKNFEWSHEVNEKILHHKSINQMLITYCHLTCKDANYCLNVHERVEVVEWNERQSFLLLLSPPFPYCHMRIFSVCERKLWQKKKMFKYTIGKNTSTRCLKDVLSRQERHLAKTSSRCPKDVLNANLKDILKRPCRIYCRCLTEDVLKMSF